MAERLCEVWGQRLRVPCNKPARAEVKLDAMLECFHDHAVVHAGAFQIPQQDQHAAHATTDSSASSSSSSAGWALATGSSQLREAFDAASTVATTGSTGAAAESPVAIEPLQRAYVEIAGDAALPTFCLDLYPPGAAPGFTASGFLSGTNKPSDAEAVAVLYRVERSRISQMWVGPAGDAAATTGDNQTSKEAPPNGLAGSKLFVGHVLDLLYEAYGPDRLSEMQVHVHDYTNIPTVG